MLPRPFQHILDLGATLLQSKKDGDVETDVVWLWVDTPQAWSGRKWTWSGVFSVEPTIKSFTDLLYMLKIMQWILFKDLELFFQPCYLASNMAKLIYVLGR